MSFNFNSGGGKCVELQLPNGPNFAGIDDSGPKNQQGEVPKLKLA